MKQNQEKKREKDRETITQQIQILKSTEFTNAVITTLDKLNEKINSFSRQAEHHQEILEMEKIDRWKFKTSKERKERREPKNYMVPGQRYSILVVAN